MQVLSILLMLSTADIIISILRGENNYGMLLLTVIYCLIVILFQVITLISTRKLIVPPIDGRAESTATSGILPAVQLPSVLAAAKTSSLIDPPSIVDETTELLDRDRVVKRGSRTTRL